MSSLHIAYTDALKIACELTLARSIGGTYDTFGILKPWLGVLAEFGGILYADHVRFDPYHPYIEHLPRL